MSVPTVPGRRNFAVVGEENHSVSSIMPRPRSLSTSRPSSASMPLTSRHTNPFRGRATWLRQGRLLQFRGLRQARFLMDSSSMNFFEVRVLLVLLALGRVGVDGILRRPGFKGGMRVEDMQEHKKRRGPGARSIHIDGGPHTDGRSWRE